MDLRGPADGVYSIGSLLGGNQHILNPSVSLRWLIRAMACRHQLLRTTTIGNRQHRSSNNTFQTMIRSPRDAWRPQTSSGNSEVNSRGHPAAAWAFMLSIDGCL